MRKCLASFIVLVFFSSSVAAHEGLVSVNSVHSVGVTADRLENVLKNKGMTVFARINHAAGAEKVGITLRPTELVIFGERSSEFVQ